MLALKHGTMNNTGINPLTPMPRWTLENMRFLQFPWIRRLGKYKKTLKTSVNAGMHYAFRTLTEQWILVNSVFCEI